MSGSNGHGGMELVQEPAPEQPDLDPSTLAYGQRLTCGAACRLCFERGRITGP